MLKHKETDGQAHITKYRKVIASMRTLGCLTREIGGSKLSEALAGVGNYRLEAICRPIKTLIPRMGNCRSDKSSYYNHRGSKQVEAQDDHQVSPSYAADKRKSESQKEQSHTGFYDKNRDSGKFVPAVPQTPSFTKKSTMQTNDKTVSSYGRKNSQEEGLQNVEAAYLGVPLTDSINLARQKQGNNSNQNLEQFEQYSNESQRWRNPVGLQVISEASIMKEFSQRGSNVSVHRSATKNSNVSKRK